MATPAPDPTLVAPPSAAEQAGQVAMGAALATAGVNVAGKSPAEIGEAVASQGMSKQKKIIIAVVVGIVVLLIAIFAYGYFEHPSWWPSWMPKDSFVIGNSFGYGWDAPDYMYGAAMVPPIPCTSPYSGAYNCDMECRQFPQGMSYTDCMYHCGNKTKERGHPVSCATGSCPR